MPTFPNDENGDVLRRLQESGDQLDKPRNIDFNHIFQREEEAKQFSDAVRGFGYEKVSYKFWEDKKVWDARVVVFMAPEHGEITATESKLDALARGFSGRADGWGCFSLK